MRLRLAAAVCAAMLTAGPALAQGDICPERTIRFMIPFPPGGSTDALARLIQPRMSELLGRTILVENRGGAAGSIGTAAAAAAPGDGCTVLFVFDTHATNPTLIPNLPFDTKRDLAPLMLVGTNAMVVTAHRSAAYTDFRQVIAEGKQPGKEPAYGSIGNGSLAHLAMTQLQKLGGFSMTHVPYRGGGPAVQDLLGGNIHWHMATVASSLGHIQGGRLRALGTTHTARVPTLPEVPTIAESGYPGYTLNEWNGLYAPAGTPEPALDRLHAAALHALAQDAVKSRIETLGALTVGSPRAEFARFVSDGRERMAQLVAEAKISID